MTPPLVLVTRPESASDALPAALEERGLAAIGVPTVATRPVAMTDELDQAAGRLASYDWVVVTSPTGVRALLEACLRSTGKRSLVAHPPRWAAVGPATAAALAAAGVAADALPRQARGAAIADAIADVEPLGGRQILLPRADAADSELPRRLGAAGARVDEVVAYHTVEGPEASLERLVRALDEPRLAAVVVASGSAVRGLLALAARAGRSERLAELAIVSIGPSTSAVARQLGLAVAAEATSPTPDALADAAVAALDRPLSSPQPRLETAR